MKRREYILRDSHKSELATGEMEAESALDIGQITTDKLTSGCSRRLYAAADPPVRFWDTIEHSKRSDLKMKLYRYRSIDSKDLSRTFTHCEVYFASPTQFNDPFDCKPPFSTTGYSQEDLLSHYRKAFRQTYPGLNDSKLEAIIEKTIASVMENNTFESSVAKPFIKVVLKRTLDSGFYV